MTIQNNDITVDEAFYVRELQSYLRALQQQNGGTANIPPDGIYGEDTARAVAAFQHAAGLPVTGQTDRATWEAIREAYLQTVYDNTLHLPIQAYRSPEEFLQPGDQGDGVAFLQIMLRRLAAQHPNLPLISEVTGVYDRQTEEAVKAVQRLTGLPQTGLTDKTTWDAVTRLYNDG